MGNKDFRWDFPEEDGREVIREWSKKRNTELEGLGKSYKKFLIYTFDWVTLKSFIRNFNFVVLVQMALAAIAVYIFDRYNIAFNFHVSLFVSPIVFPLAFSINTDFQRREKVLEDLASFKSAAMLWFFCMRDWKAAAELDDTWLKAVHDKVKNMMFNLREYLLTDKIENRKFIVRCMYEDLSDCSQLIEKVRASKLPSNTAVISRAIHLLNMLCLSFERLRVIREYRSPRSIRSFNKVLILFLPIILSPYFIYLSRNDTLQSKWSAYYIAVLVAGVFGALQGVQDKLDDPFDGMSEDDIKLDTIDEWTFHNLGTIVNRNYVVGRFHVSANIDQTDCGVSTKVRLSTAYDTMSLSTSPPVSARENAVSNIRRKFFDRRSKKRKKSNLSRRNSSFVHIQRPTVESDHPHNFDPQSHPYADVLGKIKGNARIQANRKTGTILITDAFNESNKSESASSIESCVNKIENDENELNDEMDINSPTIALEKDVTVHFAEEKNKPVDDNDDDVDKPTGKHSVSKVVSANSSTDSVESDIESPINSSSLLQRPLLNTGEQPTSSRFTILPQTRLNSHMELKDITSDYPVSPVTISDTDAENSLREIIVINAEKSLTVKT